MRMDNLELRFRGRIDQVGKRVQMEMAVPAETMAKAFGLHGVIDPDLRIYRADPWDD